MSLVMDRKLQAIHQTPLNRSDFQAAHGSVAPRWPRQPRAQLFILYGSQLSGWTWHTLPGTVTTVAVSSAIVAIVSGFGEGHLCGSSSLHLGDRKAPGCRSRQLPSLLRGWSVQCNCIQTWGPPFDGENHEKMLDTLWTQRNPVR